MSWEEIHGDYSWYEDRFRAEEESPWPEDAEDAEEAAKEYRRYLQRCEREFLDFVCPAVPDLVRDLGLHPDDVFFYKTGRVRRSIRSIGKRQKLRDYYNSRLNLRKFKLPRLKIPRLKIPEDFRDLGLQPDAGGFFK